MGYGSWLILIPCEDCWLDAQMEEEEVSDGCQRSLARLSAQLSSTAEMTTAALLKELKSVNTFKKVLSSQGESNEKPPRKAADVSCIILYVQLCFKCRGCSLRIAEEYVSSQHGSWTCWTRFCLQWLGIKEVLCSLHLCQPESSIQLHTQLHSPATVFLS